MKTRRLGKTELQVSEIGFGGEWLERHPEEESIELIHYASSKGINILDCWMPDPKSRNIIGEGIKENRDKWFIQGHIGSTWKDEQYYRTREMEYVRPAFEDLLKRLQTDYIDLGMIHYVDSEEEWDDLQQSEYMDYVMELKRTGVIRHIGMSSHNPKVAKKAAESGYVLGRAVRPDLESEALQIVAQRTGRVGLDDHVRESQPEPVLAHERRDGPRLPRLVAAAAAPYTVSHISRRVISNGSLTTNISKGGSN